MFYAYNSNHLTWMKITLVLIQMTFPKDRLFLNRYLNKNMCSCKLKRPLEAISMESITYKQTLLKTGLHLTPATHLFLHFLCFTCFLAVSCSFFSLIDYFHIIYRPSLSTRTYLLRLMQPSRKSQWDQLFDIWNKKFLLKKTPNI